MTIAPDAPHCDRQECANAMLLSAMQHWLETHAAGDRPEMVSKAHLAAAWLSGWMCQTEIFVLRRPLAEIAAETKEAWTAGVLARQQAQDQAVRPKLVLVDDDKGGAR